MVTPSLLPLPVTFEDVSSSTVNETLTPGGVVRLTGTRLRFDQGDPQQGIFLIDPAKKAYRVEKILSHTGTQVVFQLPADLSADEYTLDVRVLLKGNKDVKTGTLTDRLIV
jgi:methionine-rich copper-binding protein CopC